MTGLSLFSGIGGIDIAFEAAGGRVVAMCEKDNFCRKILRKHWPDVPIFEDVKKLEGKDVGAVDVIFGGPPCQPASLAGRRRGQNDDRYLWGDVFRIVADIMPRFCVFENVFGILSIGADDICQSLERIGYSVGICCFEAAVVGAWHRRMRVFFVAHNAPVPDTPRDGRGQRDENGGRREERTGAGTWDRPPLSRSDVPYTDCERREEQRRAVSANGERSKLERPECGSGRGSKSRLGGVANGLPAGLDGYLWWGIEPDIPRTARGVPNRVNRLRSLGNAVVPAQIYPIFKAIMEVEK
jgi:DNA (cytosine-5)-methyltransferase 1